MSRIPLAIPNIGDLEGAYLAQCVEDNFVSTVGPFVTRMEEMVAARHSAAGAVAVAAGTMGLHAALVTLGARRDDLVLCPSFTFIATANAIAHAGASPWLIDIDADSWAMSPAALARALEEGAERRADGIFHKATGRRVIAVMPVYTLGAVADMDAINKIANDYGLKVIADAAAAIGVAYKGHPIGPLADLTVFSFNGNKTITTGGGGMIIGSDADLLKRAKHLTTTARVSADYEHDEVGFNYRMTNIEAAIGCAQMERLDDFIAKKRAIRQAYDEGFKDLDVASPFALPDFSESTCWFSGLVLDAQAAPSVKDVCEKLSQDGIEARPFWKPVHLQKPFADAPCEDMSVTEGLWSRILTLPCSTLLTDAEQAKVIDRTRAVLAQH